MVEKIRDVHRLLLQRDLSDVVERLRHAPIGGHGHDLGGHDPARGIRPVLEQQLERVPRVGIELVEQRPSRGRRESTHEIHLLVRRHRLDERRGRSRLHRLNDRVPAFELGLVEHLYGEIEGDHGDDLRRGRRRQVVKRLGDVRGTHSGQCLGQLGGVALQEVQQFGVGHSGSRGWPDWPGFVQRMFMRSSRRASAIAARTRLPADRAPSRSSRRSALPSDH